MEFIERVRYRERKRAREIERERASAHRRTKESNGSRGVPKGKRNEEVTT